jgi:hypothetical protein
MNKMIVSLLRCDAYESEMLLTAFANLLRTYRHACARYPEVRRINDQHVVEFCRSSARRHKTWTNDLGCYITSLPHYTQHPIALYTTPYWVTSIYIKAVGQIPSFQLSGQSCLNSIPTRSYSHLKKW